MPRSLPVLGSAISSASSMPWASSSFFKAGMLLGKNAGVARIATGLPMSQGPQDFYGQGRFIRMFNGRSYYAYRG